MIVKVRLNSTKKKLQLNNQVFIQKLDLLKCIGTLHKLTKIMR